MNLRSPAFMAGFEQTVQSCLLKELAALGLKPSTDEQIKLPKGRAKADLRIGHVVVEIKTSGLFGMSHVQKYRTYRRQLESAGYRYLFFTAYEGYLPCRRGLMDAVGRRNVFLLDLPGHWPRFIKTVAEEIQKNSPATRSARTARHGGLAAGERGR